MANFRYLNVIHDDCNCDAVSHHPKGVRCFLLPVAESVKEILDRPALLIPYDELVYDQARGRLRRKDWMLKPAGPGSLRRYRPASRWMRNVSELEAITRKFVVLAWKKSNLKRIAGFIPEKELVKTQSARVIKPGRHALENSFLHIF